MPYTCCNINLRSLQRSNGIFLYFYFSDGWPSVGEGKASKEWISALFLPVSVSLKSADMC